MTISLRKIALKIASMIIFAAGISATGTNEIKVSYISVEAIYIDRGSDDGLNLGDSLRIYHNDSLSAILIITNISSNSSACEISEQFGNIATGDIVTSMSLPQRVNNVPPETAEDKKPRVPEKRYSSNRLRGSISIQNYWQQDYTGASLSYTQPSLVSRLTVDNISGRDLQLSLRHRSRRTYRDKQLGSSGAAEKWNHRFYELALSNNRSGDWHWRLGRQSIYELSGIGLIDGILISHNLSSRLSAGFTVGFDPDRETTDISFENRKVGLFAGWQNGSESHDFRLKLGFTGSYYKMEVNREFLSLQADYRFQKSLSIVSLAEFDINRSWRKKLNNNVLDISNLYFNLRLQATSYLSLHTSYDRRQNYRIYDTRNTPDTLFDDDLHQGLRVGYGLQINRNIRLNGYCGVRFREGMNDNNIVVSSSLSLRRFPVLGQSVISSFSYVKSEFTKGYRTSIRYSFPAGRKMHVSLTNTMYKYSGLLLSRTYYYLDIMLNYSLSRAYYISGSYRQNFDKENLSGQMFFQLGINI